MNDIIAEKLKLLEGSGIEYFCPTELSEKEINRFMDWEDYLYEDKYLTGGRVSQNMFHGGIPAAQRLPCDGH